MGIDKRLSDNYPSVIINRVRYHYGREPEFGQYLVENAFVAKDYLCFKTKEDLVAFLVNLPESAERHRLSKTYPDWHKVTAEQRDAYIEDDRAKLRASAAEKIKAGTAQEFDMDLEGQSGPHIPQRILGQSPNETHWQLGIWHGARQPYYGEEVLFRDQVMIPLVGEPKIPEPGARLQYVIAEIVDPTHELAVVVGATKNRQYAVYRTVRYERGLEPVRDTFTERDREDQDQAKQHEPPAFHRFPNLRREIYEAIEQGDLKRLRTFLAHGADPNIRTERGETPLFHAVGPAKNLAIAEHLIAKGVDVHARDHYGRTALHEAAFCGDKDTIGLLLEHGAHIGARDDRGLTPLHFAALIGAVERVRYLLREGADFNCRDDKGRTPLDLAMQNVLAENLGEPLKRLLSGQIPVMKLVR
jgi:hypothetical protein